jgi:uncharacterized membrane protein
MSANRVFIYAATYACTGHAWGDFDVLLERHAQTLIGTYNVALISTDEKGKVHVHNHEKVTQHGAWGGIAVGALVGALFPPPVLGATAVGGVVGGLGGHFREGLSRGDGKELREAFRTGEASLVVIANSLVKAQLDKALTLDEKSIQKEVDCDLKDFERDLEEAEEELAAHEAAAS